MSKLYDVMYIFEVVEQVQHAIEIRDIGIQTEVTIIDRFITSE